jgi:hypothetical protein
MKVDTLIFFMLLIGVITIAILLWLLQGGEFCFPIHGIDHNGKNEAFTIYLGKCHGY